MSDKSWEPGMFELLNVIEILLKNDPNAQFLPIINRAPPIAEGYEAHK